MPRALREDALVDHICASAHRGFGGRCIGTPVSASVSRRHDLGNLPALYAEALQPGSLMCSTCVGEEVRLCIRLRTTSMRTTGQFERDEMLAL